MEITNRDWNKLNDKFGDLILYIAHRISGDDAIASVEDNVSDLKLAALNAVNGYYKKNKITQEDRSVDDVIECPLFNKYLKVVLWNHKNKAGSRITKKLKIKPVSMDTTSSSFDISHDSSSLEVYDSLNFVEQLKTKLTDEDCGILDFIVDNPHDAIKNDGSWNIDFINKNMKINTYRLKQRFERIKKIARSI